MIKIALFLSFLVLSKVYAKENCMNFSGRYSLDQGVCFVTTDYDISADYVGLTGLRIMANPSNNELSLHYEQFNTEFKVKYIADGMVHDGDGYYSGKTYIAKCDANQIKSTRYGLQTQNGPLIEPFESVFIKNTDGSFELTENFNSGTLSTSKHQKTRTCTFRQIK